MTSLDIKLNNGVTIPALGLGTWQSPKGAVESAVEYALTEAGLRHIDAAFAYLNEEEVGNGIKKAIASGKVKREDIFITTKVFPTFHNRVEESLNRSLKNLQLEYIDLLLVHWPVGLNPNGNHLLVPTKADGTRDVDPTFDLSATWKQFEKVYESGKVKAIGVSNCSVPVLTDLLKTVKVVPAVNQIENHPLLPQTEIRDFCKEKGIVIEAYSPFGSTGGPLFSNKTVLAIAEKHKTTPGTVLVSYHISSGRVVLPKTTTPSRIVENTKTVELTPEEIKELDNVHVTEGKKRFAAPPWGVDLKFPDWNASTPKP
ncbi:glycerol 2-dehydrogenase (NADP(+)) GCY1 [Sugiyamaella lignohabitans]|uniref:Glycerol 2-dehydrogenase (NADP(+)) GCY1 n=1 Tax=Sugiyamaella lignohabitans TaxID=796027 RepID=A0A167CS02_9ASCO|nr:glycerol 2-dehydrogenase (NADP(+)) GCY1 [Sugiyamaella lignohabitans]ANB12040.1 glycerol 2-dehydrogenase (NADP(+)) GCY1 [Sugiyamaella lignohabitans]